MGTSAGVCVSQGTINEYETTFGVLLVFCLSNLGKCRIQRRVVKICFLLTMYVHIIPVHTFIRGTGATELVSLYRMKNGRGHWICWMSMSRKNDL